MGGAWLRRARKLASAAGGVLLFILALELVKAGASELGGLVTDTLSVRTPANALGFGWILATVVLSGSPIAAVALAFFSSGIVTDIQALLMITGSRLGASLVILGLALIYHLRGARGHTSLEVGLLAVLVTFSVYLPATLVGWLMLASGALDPITFPRAGAVFDSLDAIYGPIVHLASARLPEIVVAALGIGALILAIQLFDWALPEVRHLGVRMRGMVERVFRPSVMLGVGALVTAFTLSVSVSLGLLVPLAARGYIRRENLIPYILGANVTTFIDTLFASLLVNDPRAFTIVLAEVVAVAGVSLGILTFAFHRYEHLILVALDKLTASRAALTGLIATLLIAPFLLMLL